jgi:hypothetical protein
MNAIQRMAFFSGLAFVLVSVAGFFVTGIRMPGMTHSLEQAPALLGVFPLNVAHNLVHFAFGAWGLFAARTTARALVYGLGSGAAYLVLAILGVFAPTLFGLVPLGGWDIVLHLALAAVLTGISTWWLMQDQPSGDARAAERKVA